MKFALIAVGLLGNAFEGPGAVTPSPAGSTPGIPIKLAPGFVIETVYSVPSAEGSWVSLAVDPRGRLVTSDQFGKLYRLTLPVGPNEVARSAPLDVNVGAAQGLLWAFDSLYVVANRPKDKGGSGLYRLQDQDGDDRFEKVRLLRTIDGDGEHGPHAVVAGPDGRSLYVLAGNATYLPSFDRSMVPRGWGMDMPLPALGQSDGVWRTNRPGGWIARLDPEGRSWDLVAVGLRNPYDLAFNADGELFTFDADMEWDLGAPWYRPTRVNHVTSGAEFGWRTGSSKWPDYYADSEPAIVDVGESSPTGLTFGYGARFPAPYQRALFMGDWSYGKIYALHLEPAGATYTARLEQFLAGSPLPITDIVIRPQDGALYFLTGGRGTPSTLYRVTYRGPANTARVDPVDSSGAPERSQRRRLEQFHGRQDAGAIDAAWPFLGHAQRAMRYAARVALEHQPVAHWRARALAEPQVRSRLTALLALVRCGTGADSAAVVQAVRSLDWDHLNLESQLDIVRICSLIVTRLGPVEPDTRRAILELLDRRFPAARYELNRELSQLLVALEAPGIVGRAIDGMESAASQEEQLHNALCLRTLDPNLWRSEERERFFRWITRATAAGGGVTYSEYLRSIRSEAIEKLTPDNHGALKPTLLQPPPPDPYAELKQRSLVKAWTVDDLLEALAASKSSARDLDRGRRIYGSAMCIKCHRINRQGGLTGPDLTGVGNRFDDRTILESILEPSKVVSDQYATVEVETRDGDSYTGRIGDQNEEEILLKADLLNPANVRRIRRADIASITPSPTSLMPTALVDCFDKEEILDLIAYVKAQGQPKSVADGAR